MSNVIIHHGHCPDGFGAGWLARRTLFPGGRLYAAAHNTPPPYDLTDGQDVLVVDFCYPAAELDELAARSRSLLVLDHHQTSRKWVAESSLRVLGSPEEYVALPADEASAPIAVHTNDHSGIGLVACIAAARGFKIPDWVWDIEDRDLWRTGTPDGLDVHAAVTSHPQTVEVWDSLARTPRQRLADEGAPINRFRSQLVTACLDRSFELKLGGLVVLCASSPETVGPEVGHELAVRSPSGVGAYCVPADSYVRIGLRSMPDGVDVAELAALYGGGGHRPAAGLRLSWDEFNAARDAD